MSGVTELCCPTRELIQPRNLDEETFSFPALQVPTQRDLGGSRGRDQGELKLGLDKCPWPVPLTGMPCRPW